METRNFQENFGLIFDRQHHVELEVPSLQQGTVPGWGSFVLGFAAASGVRRGAILHALVVVEDLFRVAVN